MFKRVHSTTVTGQTFSVRYVERFSLFGLLWVFAPVLLRFPGAIYSAQWSCNSRKPPGNCEHNANGYGQCISSGVQHASDATWGQTGCACFVQYRRLGFVRNYYVNKKPFATYVDVEPLMTFSDYSDTWLFATFQRRRRASPATMWLYIRLQANRTSLPEWKFYNVMRKDVSCHH